MSDVSPAQFAELMAQIVAQKLATQPARQYNVNRMDVSGAKRSETISLPQVMAELVDEMRCCRAQQQEFRVAVDNLSVVMDDNRKLARRILKRSRNDDEDEDER